MCIYSNSPQIIWNNKLASSVKFVFPRHLSVLFTESTAASLLSKTYVLFNHNFFSIIHHTMKTFSVMPMSVRNRHLGISGVSTTGPALLYRRVQQQLSMYYCWRVQWLKLGASEVTTVSWKSPTLAVGNTRTRHCVTFSRTQLPAFGIVGGKASLTYQSEI